MASATPDGNPDPALYLVAEPGIYDLKGLKCPLPVLRAKKRLAGMRPGSRLWLETTDPLAAIDIPAFCTAEGHHLIKRESAGQVQRFLVERGPEEAN